MSPRNSGLLLHRSLSPLFHIWEIIIWKLLYILIRTTYLKTFGGFSFPSAVSINIPSNSLTVWKTGIRHVVWFTSLCSSSAHAYAVNCSQVLPAEDNLIWWGRPQDVTENFQTAKWILWLCQTAISGSRMNFQAQRKWQHEMPTFPATFQAYAKGQKCHSNTGWSVTTLLAEYLSLQDCFNTY